MKARTHRLLERFSPPGLDVAREVRALRTGGVVAFIFSLTFFLRFFPARQALFRWDGLTYVLVSGEQMADFSVVLGSALYGFYILAVAALLTAALRRAYFEQDSKSIYTMRRLPRRETAQRCLVLPVLYALAALAAAFLLLCLYYFFYMAVTPAQCLPPHQWQRIWSVLSCWN
jgi:hypothetical protein